MKALILAAGIGKRLKSNIPKILLKINNKTLLERHYENLLNYGIKEIGIVVGYKSNLIKKFISKIDKEKVIKIFNNSNYKMGSIVSLICASKFFNKNNDLILMDGDVLYDKKILKKLIKSKKRNCLLLDRNFEEGDEPVKVCIKNNKICDFGKIISNNFDYVGESVGFFRFSNSSSKKILENARTIMKSNNNEMYEEAIRKVIINKIFTIDFEDITNLSWTEIDYKKDLVLAKKKILHQINE